MNESDLICRLIVSSYFEADACSVLSKKLGAVQDWNALLRKLEDHGLASLACNRIRESRLTVDDAAHKVLRGLEVRDRHHWNHLRRAVCDVGKALSEINVEFACLKGIAFANSIYPAPHLRPMDDLDILIARRDIEKAQHALNAIGFANTAAYTGHLRHHHHLPPLIRKQGAIEVMVELHTQGVSRDYSTNITLDALSTPMFYFEIDGVRFNSLGHLDHLRLLCRHAFGRRAEVRLLGVMDILQYSDRYFEEIDWKLIQRVHPFIINTLRCLYPLTGIPERLREIAPEGEKKLKNVGKGMVPLTQIMSQTKGLPEKLKQLFIPSDWWTHIFYNIPPERSLNNARLIYHPLCLLRWAIFRSGA